MDTAYGGGNHHSNADAKTGMKSNPRLNAANTCLRMSDDQWFERSLTYEPEDVRSRQSLGAGRSIAKPAAIPSIAFAPPPSLLTEDLSGNLE